MNRIVLAPLIFLANAVLTLSVLLATIGNVGANWAAAWIHTLTGKEPKR